MLNRLAAGRMAGARAVIGQSVGNGFQARAFSLCAVGWLGLGETAMPTAPICSACLMNSRRTCRACSTATHHRGRLFPREAALLQVLNLINDADIAPLWSEDETIGWIYQYFNSKEERQGDARRIAGATQQPWELAVRNQFFTPRYVVEFWWTTPGPAVVQCHRWQPICAIVANTCW